MGANNNSVSSGLSNEALHRLLARALEIQATSSERDLRVENFCAAGIEQGFDEHLLEAAFAEFKNRQERVYLAARMAEDSSVRMSMSGNDVVFIASPPGPKASFLPEIAAGIALLGLSILRGWIAKALMPIWPLWFAVFPLAGLWYLGRALYRMSLKEEIRLSTEGGSIKRSVGCFAWQVVFRPSTLIVKLDESGVWNAVSLRFEWNQDERYLLRQTLLPGHEAADKKWVASVIRAWLPAP